MVKLTRHLGLVAIVAEAPPAEGPVQRLRQEGRASLTPTSGVGAAPADPGTAPAQVDAIETSQYHVSNLCCSSAFLRRVRLLRRCSSIPLPTHRKGASPAHLTAYDSAKDFD